MSYGPNLRVFHWHENIILKNRQRTDYICSVCAVPDDNFSILNV